MNWKWWVAVQIAILAFIGEIIIPYSEFFFLSIIYRLERRVFFGYVTYDAISFVRALSQSLPTIDLNPSHCQNNLPKLPASPIPQLHPGPVQSMVALAGAIAALPLCIYFVYVKPIKYIIHLRRRILHEVLHIQ